MTPWGAAGPAGAVEYLELDSVAPNTHLTCEIFKAAVEYRLL